MEAATQSDSMMLEQYVDFLEGALFAQISQPVDYRHAASIKNHNELLRCFAVIGQMRCATCTNYSLVKRFLIFIHDNTDCCKEQNLNNLHKINNFICLITQHSSQVKCVRCSQSVL